jgi:hypothetical protein
MTIDQFREKLEALLDEARRGGIDMTDLAEELEEMTKTLMAAGEG